MTNPNELSSGRNPGFSDIESDSNISNGILEGTTKRSTPSPEPSLQKRTKIANSRFNEMTNLHKPIFDKSLPKNFGILDVDKLGYATKNLQKSLNTVLEVSPDVLELNQLLESDTVNEGVKLQVKSNELISMASKLKSLYRIKKLPIIDQIINNKIEITDEYVNKLRDITKSTDKFTIQLPKNEVSDIHTKGINNTLPELPKINDQKLYERVFTHKSFVKNKNYLSSVESIHLHNERLEFLGDSVLNNLVTLIIFDEFKNSNEGELSKIRASLVCNKTLLKFAYEYGFDTRLRSTVNKDIIKSGDQKIFADVFEAYVGALSLERGADLQEVQNWLAEIFAPLIFELKKEANKVPLDNNAKSELYSLIGRTDLYPQYVVINEGDGLDKKFIVSCRMNGEEIGQGKEKSIKDAGIRAAMEALKNKDMMNKYFLERRNIERPVKEERMKRDSIRKETRLKEMEQERANEWVTLPSAPPSPIRLDMFPIEVDPDAPIDHDCKGELYGMLGRKIGDKPEYTSYTNIDGTFTSELRIRGILICSTIDRSKKKAMAKAAQALLNNQLALDQICKDFRTKDLEFA